MKTLRLAILTAFILLPSLVLAGNCDNPTNDFDGVYCLTKNYLAVDTRLNETYGELISFLTDDQKRQLNKEQIQWMKERNATCSIDHEGRFFIDLNLATQSTLSRLSYLNKELQRFKKSGDVSLSASSDTSKPLDPPLLNLPRPYKVSTFSAMYFNGTDHVSSEMVTHPSINYENDVFCKIPASSFEAVWEANIDAQEACRLPISFASTTHGMAAFFLDDVSIPNGLDSNGSLSIPLETGAHRLRIEYKNHGYRANFNAAVVNYPGASSKGDLQVFFEKALSNSARSVHISGETTTDYNNNVHVYLPDEGPVFLVLESQTSINWTFYNQSDVRVSGVLICCDSGASTVTGIREDTPVYHVEAIDRSVYQGMLPEAFDYEYKEKNMLRADFSY
ncbi:lysozyme inhibitor lpri n-terminal [Desulfoluna butyratoxydans]|uniref:Lysozyme inhibitor lpri n-terminal n=2 Tax=Desulfoluna butyratoxydans TaxID=231438 RepID=A0A4U8YQ76_9BACT|nr:lysozyme inhibitor lpri n-terminal [Desulfoluna butyratoxydans]